MNVREETFEIVSMLPEDIFKTINCLEFIIPNKSIPTTEKKTYEELKL